MMNIQIFILSPFLCFTLVINLVNIQSSLSNPSLYADCSPNSFTCGNLTASYPFWGGEEEPLLPGCGHPELKLTCENDHITTTIMINDVKYRVLDVNDTAQILKIARDEYFQEGICGLRSLDTTTIIDPALFVYPSDEYCQNLTLLYDCPAPSRAPGLFACTEINGLNFIKEGDHDAGKCRHSVVVPVPRTLFEKAKVNSSSLELALKQGLEVQWKLNGVNCEKCRESKGICKYDDDPENQTVCICPNQGGLSGPCPPPIQPPIPSKPTSDGPENKIILPVGGVIGIAAGAAVIFLGGFFFLIIYRRRKIAAQSESRGIETPPSPSTNSTTNLSKSVPSRLFSKSDLEKGSSYFGAQVFSYTELQQATHNFHSSKELGDGGFGIVYYGVLNDGRVVAVKRLFEKNFKRVEQFMNEVEILTRIRHPNLVTLYGCTSRHSRELLLVYEYIPNGTVADHLHGRNSNSGLLPWHVRLSIAIDTAAALAYLHASDIIHRDVKTNNILLDSNFNVKVADFGLSRLFPTDVTHVSTAPQGTPGYVDPEYHQCYQLTDKSDVYSFGVVLIELISSLQAVDTNRHRHDINLANMATSRIQNNALNELVDPCIGFEKDFVVRNMVTSVAELAFRCLQQDREMRPCMDEVLEVLKGIENQKFGAEKAEVVDIRSTETDEVGLLKNIPVPPPLSPVSSSTATDSF